MSFARPYVSSRWTLAAQQSDDMQSRTLLVEAPGAGLGADDFDRHFDFCAIEFDDDGRFVDSTQCDNAVKAITEARQGGGAVVMLFVHGWKHNADWNDLNFVSFRNMVASMAYRESERYGGPNNKHLARRVVGIYLGWEGTEDGGWVKKLQKLTQLDYWSRDASARTMAAGSDLGQSLRRITVATKDPAQPGADNSPLIFAGHSMGGLILEGAMVHWVNADDDAIPGFANMVSNPLVSLAENGVEFAGPDVVLLINPASVAADSQALVDGLRTGGWRKKMNLDSMSYEPPLVISVTSTGDWANFIALPTSKFVGGQGAKKTAGFTPSMHTHVVENAGSTVCEPAGSVDFGQHWHCLEIEAATRHKVTPTMEIGLPDFEGVRESHTQYRVVPKDSTKPNLMWIMQVPDEIIDDHSDIFNPAAASLFLALFQISGAVVSINTDWKSLVP